jgi:hypothetical protein
MLKAEFSIESDDKLILDGLAFMAMKPSKSVRDYFGCLNKLTSIIMDAYKSYTINPAEPVPDNNNWVDLEECRAYKRECDENLGPFFLLNCFLAGLPTDLCRVINLPNMEELELNTVVRLATIEACSKEEAHSKVYATAYDEQDQVEEHTQVQPEETP